MSLDKKLLVVVDYQKDFVNGTLGFDGAEKLYEKILKKVKEYKEQGNHIVITKDTHGEEYLQTIEGKYLPVRHCIKGTEGHDLYGEELKRISEEKDVYTIEKSKFGTLEFIKIKDEIGDIESVELCGIDTNICVLSNAIICQTVFNNSEIYIEKSLCGSYNKELEQKTFDVMKNLQMIIVE